MNYIIYTDGGCAVKTTQRGGWAVVVYSEENVLIDTSFGGKDDTTNNQMELEGFYRAIKWILYNDVKKVSIKTDSSYTKNIFSGMKIEKDNIVYGNSWVGKWIKNQWKKQGEIKNLEQIKKIHNTLVDVLLQRKIVEIEWCKSHCGIEGNELADTLATIGQFRKKNFKK